MNRLGLTLSEQATPGEPSTKFGYSSWALAVQAERPTKSGYVAPELGGRHLGFQIGQQRRCVRPGGGLIQHAEAEGDQVVVGQIERLAGLGIDDLYRAALQPLGEGGVTLSGLAGEGTVRACGITKPEELFQRALGADVAAQAGAERQPCGLGTSARRPRDRVDDAVDDEGPDLSREKVGVGLAEDRAVGVAEVVQLLVADQLAEPVQVAGDVGGGHVPEDGAAVGRAGRSQFLVGDALLLFLGRGLGKGNGGQVGNRLLEGVVAAQRRASRNAARVEADDVEPGPDLKREELSDAAGEVDARPARPAGVEEERADPSGGSWKPGAGSVIAISRPRVACRNRAAQPPARTESRRGRPSRGWRRTSYSASARASAGPPGAAALD